MIQWTSGANKQWDAYCRAVGEKLRNTEADINEVIEDVRRHVETELASLHQTVVTAEDLKSILNRIGLPENPGGIEETQAPTCDASAQTPRKAAVKFNIFASVFILLGGVMLPLGAAGFELLSRICTELFFDPLPSLWHVALFISIPACNVTIFIITFRQGDFCSKWFGFLIGLATGVAVYYTVWFIPLLPFSAMGAIFIGIGLCGLAPLLSLTALILSANRLRCLASVEPSKKARIPFHKMGIACGIGVLIVLVIPTLATYIGLRMVNSEQPQTQTKGIQLIRRMGSEKKLHQLCYLNHETFFGSLSGTEQISVESIRGVYYRVTGKSFNAERPRGLSSFGRAAMFEDFDFNTGDSVVGARLKNLALIGSQMDGLLHPDGAVGYFEWVMVFENTHRTREQEARCTIQLPPDGVVSRLTLWIDGQECEAAFGGRSQTRQAYQSVVQRRRDPILVTTKGHDQILVQCYPVTPNGGKMKVRIGITFPLPMLTEEQLLVPLPTINETNFAIAETLEHTLWLESRGKLAGGGAMTESFDPDKRLYAVRGTLDHQSLQAQRANIRTFRDPAVTSVRAERVFADETVRVLQQMQLRTESKFCDKMIIVLDMSESMKSQAGDIVKAFRDFTPIYPVSLIGAADVETEHHWSPGGRENAGQFIARVISKSCFNGGMDNLPALMHAVEQSSDSQYPVIVWIHAAQPHLFMPVEPLVQYFTRRPAAPAIIHVQVRPGPNRIIEELNGHQVLEALARGEGLDGDLRRLLEQCEGKAVRGEWVRLRVDAFSDTEQYPESSSHLVRLWAKEEIERLRNNRSATAQSNAQALAVKHQLVTPVSGAVVLENRQQYTQHNLQPVDPETVPVIPEPHTIVLMSLGAIVMRAVRKRNRPKPKIH